MVVERLFLAVPQGCLRFVIVVFPDHTHLLFFMLFLLSRPYELQHLLYAGKQCSGENVSDNYVVVPCVKCTIQL